MECAIFCLLAFCVIQAVSAVRPMVYIDHEQEDPGFKSVGKMYDILMGLKTNIEATQKAMSKSGIQSECASKCFTWDDETQFMETIIQPSVGPCRECHQIARRTKDVKLKKMCCVDAIGRIQWQATLRLNQAKKCIAECKSTPIIKKPQNPNKDKRKQKNKNPYAPVY